jgi:integrase
MAIYRYHGSRVWTMDFMFMGQRIRESTHQISKTRAQEAHDRRKQEVRDGVSGYKKPVRPLLLAVAVPQWLALKKAAWSPKTYIIEKTNIAHLSPELGRLLLTNIEAKHIVRYQQNRLAEKASPKTINLEIGTLRAILRHYRLWANIQQLVTMLPVADDIGRALTVEEERYLLDACAKSRSRSLLPFAVLAIETGARYGVLRTLQWKRVDFSNQCLQFGKDKTVSGTGRFVPLSPRAMASLQFWAQQFPNRLPEHYVFPSERYGASGDEFKACVYASDPDKPMARFKASWEKAKRDARLECRFHDLRHTAVSRMIDAGVPLPKVAKIVGWAPATMVRMAARYGHFNLESLRDAVATINRGEFRQESPVIPPVSRGETERKAN